MQTILMVHKFIQIPSRHAVIEISIESENITVYFISKDTKDESQN